MRTIEYVNVQDHEIHLELFGKGGDVKVLFLHGFLAHPRSYMPLISAMVEMNVEVLAPTMVGHGLSTGTRGQPDVNLHTEVAIRAAKHQWGDESVVVMGHSMGGLIASMVTLSGDIDVKKLIVISPLMGRSMTPQLIRDSGGIDGGSVPTLILRVLSFISKAIPFPLTVSVPLSSIDLVASEETKSQVATKFWEDPLVAHTTTLNGMYIPSIAARTVFKNARKIKCPVVAMHGSQDRVTRASETEAFSERVVNGVFISIEGCGHEPHNESDAIKTTFLQGIVDALAGEMR